MKETPHISVVSPVYGSPELIPVLCERVKQSVASLTESFELILVFDCSPDDGWSRIEEECRKDPRVKGVCLSRNFGQHYAITAGLEHSSGEWVVVMDCDLQDRPEEIPNLYQKMQEGYDVVLSQRTNRQHRYWKRVSSKLFYTVFSYLTDSEQDASVANFGLYRRSAVEAILSMGDQVRYFPTMSQWVGFRRASVSVEHGARDSGESTYSPRSLFKLAFATIIAFSDKPLHLTVKLGMALCLLSFGAAAYYFARYYVGGISVSGFTSIILSIWFLSGVIIFILGVLGIYLGRVFDQTKGRPSFIVRTTENLSGH